MTKKKQRITIRQRKYLKGLALGKTKKAAALDAGYSKTTANSPKSQIEDHVGKCVVSDALKKEGLTEQWIAKRLKCGAYSKRSIPTKKGLVNVPDNMARARFMELIGRWRGDFKEKHEITGTNGGPIDTKTEIIIGGVIENLGVPEDATDR